MKTPEEMRAESDIKIKEAGALTEKEMAEAKTPYPKTIEELTKYIEGLVNRPHGYGTCVYAMSLGAVATFNFIAHALRVSGFQASCADLDILKHTRNWKTGTILDFQDLLYPQYRDKFKSFDELIDENKDWLKKEAAKKLKESPHAHDNVVAHWQFLVNL